MRLELAAPFGKGQPGLLLKRKAGKWGAQHVEARRHVAGSVAASQVRGVHRVGAVARAFCQKLVRRLGSRGQSVICRRRE